jgi:hypothetical protein
MPKAKINISLGLVSYQSPTLPFSAQRCVNLYPAVAEAKSWSPFMLKSMAGALDFGTAGTGVSRGSVVMDGVLYTINGTTLFSIDSLGVSTTIGTILGEKRVVMAHNGEKLAIVAPDVAGFNMWEYNATADTLTRVSDVDYLNSSTVVFKDGFYVFTQTFTGGQTNKFFNSALNDPLTFDALDIGTAELAPDGIIGSHVSHDELYILGEHTTEVFQNIGGAGFPFQRIPGASFEKGAHSKYSPIQWEGAFYFIGGGKNEKSAIWRAAGTGEPLKISTDAIDHEIQKFAVAEIAEAFSFTYSLDGSAFVGFTIRSVNIDSRTFVFNVTASRSAKQLIWTEQQTGVSDNAWRANSVVSVYDKIIISDNVDGRLGYLDTGTYTEYGETFIREKITPPFAGDSSSLFLHKLELSIDAGRGQISGQGLDPQVEMDFSDDGARTWSNKLTRKMGKIGEYFKRVVWRRLGRIPAHRVFRFRVSDPISVSFVKLEGEATRGR